LRSCFRPERVAIVEFFDFDGSEVINLNEVQKLREDLKKLDLPY